MVCYGVKKLKNKKNEECLVRKNGKNIQKQGIYNKILIERDTHKKSNK